LIAPRAGSRWSTKGEEAKNGPNAGKKAGGEHAAEVTQRTGEFDHRQEFDQVQESVERITKRKQQRAEDHTSRWWKQGHEHALADSLDCGEGVE
jgi:hypothetical protein